MLLVDLQYASASRDHGLGAQLRSQGRAHEASWRFDRLETVAVPNAQRLLSSARAAHRPVIHVALGSSDGSFVDIPVYLRQLIGRTDNRVGAPNHAFLDEVTPRAGERVVRKSTADAFIGTDLEHELREDSVDTVILCGVSTNTCVESTARHAADLGFGVVLVEDACAAANEPLHSAALANLARLFVEVVTTDEALAILSR